jgi:hypothetical protein
MKKFFAMLAAVGFASVSLQAFAAPGEPWVCRYKGYTPEGQYYYIVVKPFDGNGDPRQDAELNSSDFAKSLFDQLAPGNRFSGERACAMRPKDVTDKWWAKLLADDDMFSGPYNTTLAEWRDGRLVKLPWPKPKK